ncbi:nibrin [Neocloeon triangulifer]|uniref:nibrin n=1 Tax=Neocloeon triangulifer TaxID=2078957 RepID=UPI00286F0D4D|nr:nibrin [Neocloeon triangulifer]
MLFFSRERTEERVHLLAGVTYTVGSQSSDFPLQQDGKFDKSISRTHSKISVNFAVQNSVLTYECTETIPPTITLIDHSKYGVYVNDGIETKEKTKTEVVLSCGDKVRFGLQWNIFSLNHEPLIVLVTTGDDRLSIGGSVWKLCGYTLDVCNYDISHTHFSTNEVTMTPQLLCSLCKNVPIVKLSYWDQLLKAVKDKSDFPATEDFVPTISDPQITSSFLKHNEKRCKLFKDKTFIFTDFLVYQKYKEVVECAGGVPSKWQCCTLPVEEIMKSDEYVVIGGPRNYNSDESTKSKSINMKRLVKLQEKYGYRKRFVPVEEIGMAILKCDADTFCNPNFKPSTLIRPRKSMVDDKKGNILVPDTQDTPSTSSKVAHGNMVVLETVEDEFDFEESLITFRETTTASTSKSQSKRPAQGKTQSSPVAKVARMDVARPSTNRQAPDPDDREQEDDPFEFDLSTALCKPTVEKSQVEFSQQDEETPSTPGANRKRARIESSSEEEEVEKEDNNDEDEDDPFQFEEILPSKSNAKKTKISPVKPKSQNTVPVPTFLHPSTSRCFPEETDNDDDYDLESKWIDLSIKTEPEEAGLSSAGQRISRMSNDSNRGNTGSVSVLAFPVNGSQKVFSKTSHRCMKRLPKIISFAEMRKVNSVTGRPVGANGH